MMCRSLKIIILFALTVMLAQCAQRTLRNEFVYNTVHYEYASLQPAEFQKEIERLKGSAQKTQAPPDAAQPHIKLAFLYSHYRNPLPDYYRALEHLRMYASLDPEGGKQVYVQNWLAILREIAILGSANQDQKEKAEQMKKDIVRIEKENAEMKEKLEKLKHLDIELEQKRKLVK
ncbi:MAG: hypothetical protein C4538_10290 [Nitrospiraceae bacterium]|nr:MAG: hypothetical protein C4538_10290 [Nitrospiraceae bacterium]